MTDYGELIPGSATRLKIEAAVAQLDTARTQLDIGRVLDDIRTVVLITTGMRLQMIELPWTTRDAVVARMERDLLDRPGVTAVLCTHDDIVVDGITLREWDE